MTDNHPEEHHDHEHKQSLMSQLVNKLFGSGHSHETSQYEDFYTSTEEGIRVVKLSFMFLMITAALQVIVVYYTGSVGLAADTLHNFSDAFTAIPLYIAYKLSQKSEENKRYTYGYGRAEDLAGLFIVIMIALSAILIFWQSINRLINPKPIRNLIALSVAAVIGFIGNELVARYRIDKGREIGSEALVADGQHARSDGLTSLAVLAGVIGSVMNFPEADAIVGIIIGVLILFILRDAAQSVIARLMDAVDPELIEDIDNIVCQTDGVESIHNLRARWSGRKIFAEFHVVVKNNMTIRESHELIEEIEQKLKKKVNNIAKISIHVDV